MEKTLTKRQIIKIMESQGLKDIKVFEYKLKYKKYKKVSLTCGDIRVCNLKGKNDDTLASKDDILLQIKLGLAYESYKNNPTLENKILYNTAFKNYFGYNYFSDLS